MTRRALAAGLALAAIGLALGAAAGCRAAKPPAPGPDVLTLAVRADVTGFFPNPPVTNEAYTDIRRPRTARGGAR